ncbi:LacI family transcriptional regulator [Paenibacillus psychroresistens]|uniref:LacI family transcriptional regulator n=1 Tax=Paenibacillus psychroresistens TaxID=1778678 RepID=A0A6B8REB0_9BACL|nr:LacI family DNA-binding transcriptional regulator [Paenibacillus psychroresistens]QGQ94811.1 LacI family transcriptional regulator [Paenibacillus psychroresistens]
MAKKITMDVIADHLGISKFAVSKALAGKNGVSELTREKVLKAASQLGYYGQRGSVAKSGTKKEAVEDNHTRIKPVVIVLIPKVRLQSMDSLYWGRILDEIAVELEQKNVGMMMITDFSSDNFLKFINPQGLIGVLCVGGMSASLLLEIRQMAIPFILVDHEDQLVPSDSIFMNNMDCEVRLVDYLHSLGHTSFQFIGNPAFSRSFADRWLGFRSSLENHGIIVTDQMLLPLLEDDRYSYTLEIKNWIVRRMAEQSLPTALVCANDAIAMSALEALQALQISVPEQVSVCGFDNIDDAVKVQPNLTTINVDKQAMGKRAVEALFRRIEQSGALYEKILLSGDLVIRNSTGMPYKRSE